MEASLDLAESPMVFHLPEVYEPKVRPRESGRGCWTCCKVLLTDWIEVRCTAQTNPDVSCRFISKDNEMFKPREGRKRGRDPPTSSVERLVAQTTGE
eukprot:scaffold1923_cov333-Pavlova_lutheri.AAC.5